MASDFKDTWAEKPRIDYIAPTIVTVVVLAALLVLGASVFDAATRRSVYTGLGTVAGLAFAASTFVCSMTYQSTNYLMSDIRKSHSVAIRRNWISILSSLIAVAILSVALHVIDALTPSLAMGLAAGGLAVVLLRVLRALWWMRQTLFVEDASSQKAETSGYDKSLLARKF